jgi:hypothetical protein
LEYASRGGGQAKANAPSVVPQYHHAPLRTSAMRRVAVARNAKNEWEEGLLNT